MMPRAFRRGPRPDPLVFTCFPASSRPAHGHCHCVRLWHNGRERPARRSRHSLGSRCLSAVRTDLAGFPTARVFEKARPIWERFFFEAPGPTCPSSCAAASATRSPWSRTLPRCATAEREQHQRRAAAFEGNPPRQREPHQPEAGGVSLHSGPGTILRIPRPHQRLRRRVRQDRGGIEAWVLAAAATAFMEASLIPAQRQV